MNTISATDAARHLQQLTSSPDRHVGSEGNRAATDYFARQASRAGFEVARHEFECLEWEYGVASLDLAGLHVEANVGPYSPAAQVQAPLQPVSCPEELESEKVRGAIVLLHGDIASHQYMPRNFPFYNPESHKRVYRALDRFAPAAIVAATGLDPEMVGSQYPFPLFEDGDLLIPSAYITDREGERFLGHEGEMASLRIDSERIPTTAEQVVARKPGTGAGRIVVAAHIDSRKDSPGALDNASGVAALLCLAGLLADYSGMRSVELVPFNGEDNYAAPGQRLWLDQNDELGDIALCINVDDAGLKGWGTGISFYGCSDELRAGVLGAAAARPGFDEGPEWFQGDHSIFVMRGVPAIAIASAGMYEFMSRYAHSERDVVDLADEETIARIAVFIRDVIDIVESQGAEEAPAGPVGHSHPDARKPAP